MLQLKPVCHGYLKAALRIANQFIRNFACFFFIFLSGLVAILALGCLL